jgi:hypothetical protein
MEWGAVSTWVVAVVALIVALFQDWMRNLLFGPRLRVTIQTAVPDCVWMPYGNTLGGVVNTIHARMRVWNDGRYTAAADVEVYASDLRRLSPGGTWETVGLFPPMNLVWADSGQISMPLILPGTGKHCNLGHIADPALRHTIAAGNPNLHLTPAQTSFQFLVVTPPSTWGHIIPPGIYELVVHIGARNVRAIRATISIAIDGRWFAAEQEMLVDGIHVRVVLQG